MKAGSIQIYINEMKWEMEEVRKTVIKIEIEGSRGHVLT